MPKTTGLTYRDLLEMFPEETMRRVDLIEGELIVAPAPTLRHQRVSAAIFGILRDHAAAVGGLALYAPVGVWLSEQDVVQPDLLYIGPSHMDRIEAQLVRGAPDLVVEVSSPSTRRDDLGRKKDLYERFRVPEYWFVDLASDQLVVFTLIEGRYERGAPFHRGDVLESNALPGFSAPVDELLGPPER